MLAALYRAVIPALLAVVIAGISVVSISPGFAQSQSPQAELHIPLGHRSQAAKFVFSPDGNFLASMEGRDIKLWDVRTGREIRTFVSANPYTRDFAFLPDGAQLISNGTEGFTLWDVQTGREVRSFQAEPGYGYKSAFSSRFKKAASARLEGDIGIWDTDSGAKLASLTGHIGNVWDMTFSADGKRLLSAGEDRVVRLWDVSTGRLLKTFADKDGGERVAFSPDGRSIVSYGRNSFRSWNPETGSPANKASRNYHGIRGFSPDGRLMVVEDHEGKDDGQGTQFKDYIPNIILDVPTNERRIVLINEVRHV